MTIQAPSTPQAPDAPQPETPAAFALRGHLGSAAAASGEKRAAGSVALAAPWRPQRRPSAQK